MRLLIVGHGAREHALARRLSHDGHGVFVCASRRNAGLARDCLEFVFVPAYSSTAVAELAEKLTVDLLVPTDEVALFNGVADAAREIGIPCLGHPRETALYLEGARHEIIKLLEPGRYARAPEGRLVTSHSEWGAIPPAEKLVVKPVVAPGRVSFMPPDIPCKVGLPAWIEPYKPGIDFSIHYLVTAEREVFLGMTFDYHFLDKRSVVLTGGMGSVVPGESDRSVVSEALLQECKAMTERLLHALRVNQGLALSGFVSAQFRKIRQQAVFTELDCKPGNPELIALLPTLAGDLGKALLKAANGVLPKVKLNGRASVAVSMAPCFYPLEGRGRHAIGTSLLANTAVCFGETTQTDSVVVSGQSRTLCVTGSGMTIGEARAAALPLAAEIGRTTGLVYREDVGAGLAATRATERVRKSLLDLKAKGGKRIMLRLSPEAHAALKTLMQRSGFETETEAINAAINAAAAESAGKKRNGI